MTGAEGVLDRIAEREIVELALRLGNIESPPGEEGPCGEAIVEWCHEQGLPARRVGMFEDRFNVVAEIGGDGSRPSLAFNSHMDTWARRDDRLVFRDPNAAILHRAWEEDDVLVGNPVVNDKGPMAAFMVAAKAIRDAGVDLGGTVYLTMVCGEIGQEPVDEFQGKRYLSKDVGTRYVLTHGVRPSCCVNCEATGFRKGWIEAGKAFFKVTVFGAAPRYTPFVERPYPAGDEPAILLAGRLVERIEEWAAGYEREHRYESPGGTIVPRVNVGAIRGGQPWLVLQNPELCSLYLDVRTVPGQDVDALAAELRGLLADVGADGTVEQFLHRPTHEPRGVEPLAEALDAAHRTEFGSECELAEAAITSMWRDHLVFNELGIPALTYGPPGVAGSAGPFAVRKQDLLHAARVYALTALAVAGR